MVIHEGRLLDESWLVEVEERAAMAREGEADPAMARAYVLCAAVNDVPKLVSLVRYMMNRDGGDLGKLVRDAVRQRLMSSSTVAPEEVKRDAAFNPDVRVHSMSVSVAESSQVVIDIRLITGKQIQ
jgi:hypothetical protein